MMNDQAITLRSYQQDTADWLVEQLRNGGELTFSAPVGSGATIIVGEALRRYGGRVALVSRIDIIRDQTIHIFAKMGIAGSVDFFLWRKLCHAIDLSEYDLVVVTGCMQDVPIKHHNVLRFN